MRDRLYSFIIMLSGLVNVIERNAIIFGLIFGFMGRAPIRVQTIESLPWSGGVLLISGIFNRVFKMLLNNKKAPSLENVHDMIKIGMEVSVTELG